MTKTGIPRESKLHFGINSTTIDFRDKSRQEAIKENDGGLVYLLDENHNLDGELTKVRYDPNDDQNYYVRRVISARLLDTAPGLQEEERLQYNDLIRVTIPPKEFIAELYRAFPDFGR